MVFRLFEKILVAAPTTHHITVEALIQETNLESQPEYVAVTISKSNFNWL